ncbi:hypothetical protein BDW62DRAFT_49769 [Aspergillus aurantiobrunneus]
MFTPRSAAARLTSGCLARLKSGKPKCSIMACCEKGGPKAAAIFQGSPSLLLNSRNESAPLDPIPTPLGNYILLHGLLQRIHIIRNLSLPVMSNAASLPSEEVEKLEHGLRSWTSGWQQAPESTLDPNNENDPIPFTSSSLLALAYVRIYLHLGPYRQLDSRGPSASPTPSHVALMSSAAMVLSRRCCMEFTW